MKLDANELNVIKLSIELTQFLGKDCIFIKNMDQMNKTIEYWLDDKMTKERNNIRLNGYKTANTKHTYENRIRSFIKSIK